MEELELIFDENEVYLPQVVAEENKRKATENERIENENERIENEKARAEKDAERDTKVNSLFRQFDLLKEDVEAGLTKTSYLKRFSTYLFAMSFNTGSLNLPDEYSELCLLDIYVNGMKVGDYSIDLENRKIKLSQPLNVPGTPVEIVVTKLVSLNVEDYDKLAGYSPVRGIDYWTTEDISFMEQSTKQYIDEQFSQGLDAINGEEV